MSDETLIEREARMESEIRQRREEDLRSFEAQLAELAGERAEEFSRFSLFMEDPKPGERPLPPGCASPRTIAVWHRAALGRICMRNGWYPDNARKVGVEVRPGNGGVINVVFVSEFGAPLSTSWLRDILAGDDDVLFKCGVKVVTP